MFPTADAAALYTFATEYNDGGLPG